MPEIPITSILDYKYIKINTGLDQFYFQSFYRPSWKQLNGLVFLDYNIMESKLIWITAVLYSD